MDGQWTMLIQGIELINNLNSRDVCILVQSQTIVVGTHS